MTTEEVREIMKDVYSFNLLTVTIRTSEPSSIDVFVRMGSKIRVNRYGPK